MAGSWRRRSQGSSRLWRSIAATKAPGDGWRDMRMVANALFLRKFDAEYLEEMKGIADGAAAAGAKFEGRPLDLLDIVTVNADIETAFLDDALDATATGLESKQFREPAEGEPNTPTRGALQRLCRNRPGHGGRPSCVRAHHDVEPVPRLLLQRLARHQALARQSRAHANVPRRPDERARLLYERSRSGRM